MASRLPRRAGRALRIPRVSAMSQPPDRPRRSERSDRLRRSEPSERPRKPKPSHQPSEPERPDRMREPGTFDRSPDSEPVDRPRELALQLLMQLESARIPAQGRIEQIEGSLRQPQERRFFRHLVTETLRHRLRIDTVVNALLTRGTVEDLPPAIRNVLRLGTAQLILLSGVAPHAAVDTSVRLALRHGHRGTAGLVNAVLRRLAREGAERWAAAGAGAGVAGMDVAGTGAGGPDAAGAGVAGMDMAGTGAVGSDPAGMSVASTGAVVGTGAAATGNADTMEAGVLSLAIRFSHPPWLVRRWLDRWGLERTDRVLEWDNSIPDYWLRIRGERAMAEASPLAPPSPTTGARGRLDSVSVEGTDPLPPLEGARRGWIPGTLRLPAGALPEGRDDRGDGWPSAWRIQDGSAILAGLIPPEVTGLVLDLCAAPGGKTDQLADRAQPGARIVALDLSFGRLRRMRRAVNPGDPIAMAAADGRKIPIRPPWSGVLVDAPCSSLGVIRRRVDLKWRAREEEIPRLALIQANLLREAARGVVPGGWLVYSVCTLEPEETTRQRDVFFAEHADWSFGSLPDLIPESAIGRPGEMILLPGELETDGTYAFVARRMG